MNSDDKQLEIEDLTAKKNKVDDKWRAMNEKRQAELNIIYSKYEKESSSLSEKSTELEKSIDEANKEKRRLIIDEDWKEATSSGEINEFYLDALLKKCEINIHFDKEFKQKKPFKNGVDVWLISAYGYKLYLAMYKGKLVGISFRRTAEHPGDDTKPFSFIGQFEDELIVKKEIKKGYYKGDIRDVPATYTDWMKILKDTEPEKAKLTPMNQDTFDMLKEGVGNKWMW